MDLYRGGGYDDASNGIAPVVFTFPAQASQTMRIPSAGGAWFCEGPNGGAEFGQDGTLSGYCLTTGRATNFKLVGPFSGYQLTDLTGALAGVLREDKLPAPAHAGLRFYVNNSSAGGTQTNFATLSPVIGQVFFIGDGLTGTGIGSIQTFRVPATADAPLPWLCRQLPRAEQHRPRLLCRQHRIGQPNRAPGRVCDKLGRADVIGCAFRPDLRAHDG